MLILLPVPGTRIQILECLLRLSTSNNELSWLYSRGKTAVPVARCVHSVHQLTRTGAADRPAARSDPCCPLQSHKSKSR